MIPKMIKIKIKYEDNALLDIESKMNEELNNLNLDIKKGDRIAITAGSRGIDRIPILLRTVAKKIIELGGEPFLVPAMGSHGGATALGQKMVLEELGITCETVGADILSSMDVVELGKYNPNQDFGDKTETIPIVMDENAWNADGVIVINRVKKHTSFQADIESGIMKMMVVGLGKKVQAENIHSYGTKGLKEYIVPMAKKILDTGKIIAGIGLVENANDKISDIKGFLPKDIEKGEKELLKKAVTQMPALPVQDIDVLIIEQIGKNISGTGMDTNIVGRMKIQGEKEPANPKIGKIVVLDLSPETKGNAYGIGLADFITKDVFDKIDYKSMYANALASTFTERVKIPVIMPTEEQAISMALKTCGIRDYENGRVIRIKNTLSLEEIWVSSSINRELVENFSNIIYI